MVFIFGVYCCFGIVNIRYVKNDILILWKIRRKKKDILGLVEEYLFVF